MRTTSLREIYLYNTKVTAEGAKKLAASNAKLIVSHK